MSRSQTSSCRSLVALAAAVVAGGCSSSSSRHGDEGADTHGTSSGDFSVRVVKAGLTPKLAPRTAAAGNMFVVLDITLSNGSVSPSLSASLAFFTLTTESALVVRASPATTLTATPCRPEVAVAGGGSASCQLAFEISKTDAAATLGYDDTQGHTASAPVPAARDLPPPGSVQPPGRQRHGEGCPCEIAADPDPTRHIAAWKCGQRLVDGAVASQGRS